MEKHLAGLLCGAVALSLYLNTLNCGFSYDDNPAISENANLLPQSPWTDLLWNDFWGKPLHWNSSHKSYRPLCVATFRLNYMWHGLSPLGYHVVNVCLHAVVCYLYVQLCALIFNNVWPALLAGLLFAAHPIHTEAVSVNGAHNSSLGCDVTIHNQSTIALLLRVTLCRHNEKDR